jgi:hypothetical protein
MLPGGLRSTSVGAVRGLSFVAPGNGMRCMAGVHRPNEYHDLRAGGQAVTATPREQLTPRRRQQQLPAFMRNIQANILRGWP